MANNDIKDKIIKFCTEEGILREVVKESEKIDFGFNVAFPPNHPQPKKLVVLKPKNKKFIVIQVGIQISQEHIQLLKKSNPNCSNLNSIYCGNYPKITFSSPFIDIF